MKKITIERQETVVIRRCTTELREIQQFKLEAYLLSLLFGIAVTSLIVAVTYPPHYGAWIMGTFTIIQAYHVIRTLKSGVRLGKKWMEN